MKITMYRYSILDEKGGKLFKTMWISDKLGEGSGEKFIAPLTYSSESHVSVYLNKPEFCRIVDREEREFDFPNLMPKDEVDSLTETPVKTEVVDFTEIQSEEKAEITSDKHE